ncbi:hypothetical protein PG990_010282 [Apiospora arundinis]
MTSQGTLTKGPHTPLRQQKPIPRSSHSQPHWYDLKRIYVYGLKPRRYCLVSPKEALIVKSTNISYDLWHHNHRVNPSDRESLSLFHILCGYSPEPMLGKRRLSSQGNPGYYNVYQTQIHTHQALWHVPALLAVHPPPEIPPVIYNLNGMDSNMDDWSAQWTHEFTTGLGTYANGIERNGQYSPTNRSSPHNTNKPAGVGYHGFDSPRVPTLVGAYDGSGWTSSNNPSNVSTTFSCSKCHTPFKVNVAPDTPTPPRGGTTFTSTAFDPQQFRSWPNSPGDASTGASPVTTKTMPPAQTFSYPLAGGDYGQSSGFFQGQQKMMGVPTDFHLQSGTQTGPPTNLGRSTTGTSPRPIYSNNTRADNTPQPTSSGSYGNSPSDQSSPNENSGAKRKRSENKERSTKGRKPSSSGLFVYTCTVDGCNKQFGSKKEVERHLYESLAHEETYKPKYFCEERRCEKYNESFTRKDNLRRHIKDMHGDLS